MEQRSEKGILPVQWGHEDQPSPNLLLCSINSLMVFITIFKASMPNFQGESHTTDCLLYAAKAQKAVI